MTFVACRFGSAAKNENLSGGVTGLGAGDISLLEHLSVVPRHPAVAEDNSLAQPQYLTLAQDRGSWATSAVLQI
jgi:hypothetical protein